MEILPFLLLSNIYNFKFGSMIKITILKHEAILFKE
jgi:hypothetical protein